MLLRKAPFGRRTAMVVVSSLIGATSSAMRVIVACVFDAERTLRHRRQHDVRRHSTGDTIRPCPGGSRPAQARKVASTSPGRQLGKPRVDIAADGTTSRSGRSRSNCAARRSDAVPTLAPSRQAREIAATGRQEGVARILARQQRGDARGPPATRSACPSWNAPPYRCAVEQRLLDFLGEKPLAADLGQRRGPEPDRPSW